MLIVVPNISEGRHAGWLSDIRDGLEEDVRVLDVHSDAKHNRSVFTLAGTADPMVAAIERLARACRDIDMTRHEGVHPALGGLDVVPFVIDEDPDPGVEAARASAAAIGGAGIPVYLYGHAARREATRELPDLRRGGLAGLASRARGDLPPDEGPLEIDPHVGVVCVGARPPLIAFNVWIDAAPEVARAIAQQVRVAGALRALGLDLGDGNSQISMNLTAPHELGIDDAFERVASVAVSRGAGIVATEIVGLVPERFLPSPNAEAARLLKEPGRSLEAALRD